MIRWTEPTTEVAEDVIPATRLPRDAKPSELIRGWPQSRWMAGGCKCGERRCANGILAEFAGYDWRAPGTRHDNANNTPDVAVFNERTYGIPRAVCMELAVENDDHGKDAAADYLESLGF